MKKFVIIFLFIVTANVFSSQSDINNKFSQGNIAYEKGEYEKALNIYVSLGEKLNNWKLNFNIGNSYFKIDKYLKSKIYYLKALELKPFEESIKKNLQIVDDKLKIGIKLPEPGFIEKVLNKMEFFITINVLSILIIISLLFFNVILYQLVKKGRRKIYIYGIVISLLLLSILFVYRNDRIQRVNYHGKAVIIKDSKLRSGPGSGNTVLFNINRGVTVKIVNKYGIWAQVTASPEIAGWIKTGNMENI